MYTQHPQLNLDIAPTGMLHSLHTHSQNNNQLSSTSILSEQSLTGIVPMDMLHKLNSHSQNKIQLGIISIPSGKSQIDIVLMDS